MNDIICNKHLYCYTKAKYFYLGRDIDGEISLLAVCQICENIYWSDGDEISKEKYIKLIAIS